MSPTISLFKNRIQNNNVDYLESQENLHFQVEYFFGSLLIPQSSGFLEKYMYAKIQK